MRQLRMHLSDVGVAFIQRRPQRQPRAVGRRFPRLGKSGSPRAPPLAPDEVSHEQAAMACGPSPCGQHFPPPIGIARFAACATCRVPNLDASRCLHASCRAAACAVVPQPHFRRAGMPLDGGCQHGAAHASRCHAHSLRYSHAPAYQPRRHAPSFAINTPGMSAYAAPSSHR
jgi:hypothetical protein